MPNYVMNSLSFDGKEKILKAIEARIQGEDEIDFNKIIPVPKKYADNGEKEIHWRTYAWGTKWNAMDVCKDGYHYYFLTAWSPPMPVIKKLSKLYPSVEINLEYSEEAESFSGFTTFKNGKEICYVEYGGDEAIECFKRLWGVDK